MNIGDVIRKYRKKAGLTQEEMAVRLGVTAPAVSKWEKKNSYPDIALLAPIARLLHISLDTLLSFHEELTASEIGELITEMDTMFDSDGFDKVFQWASEKIKEYPNCNMLIWQIAVVLDSRRLTGDCAQPERYDEQINSWYEIALTDEDEEIKRHAADSLFGFYLRKKDYEKAEEYLQYFSDYDPMKKIYRGRLYMERGDNENAYKSFENILFSEYQTLRFTFSLMTGLAIEEKDVRNARLYADKAGQIAGIFDMGKYNECSAMLDVVCAEKNVEHTFQVVQKLLDSVDSLFDFEKSALFRHMGFRKPADAFAAELREKLLIGFRNEKEFEYMKGCEEWMRMIG